MDSDLETVSLCLGRIHISASIDRNLRGGRVGHARAMLSWVGMESSLPALQLVYMVKCYGLLHDSTPPTRGRYAWTWWAGRRRCTAGSAMKHDDGQAKRSSLSRVKYRSPAPRPPQASRSHGNALTAVGIRPYFRVRFISFQT